MTDGVFGRSRQLSPNILLIQALLRENVATGEKRGKKQEEKKKMKMFLVATIVVASRPLERQLTGTPTTRANSYTLQAKEKRIPTDVRSSRAVVEIIATKPTENPEVSDCNDKNEDLYFIMTIVFASLIGVILILLISILIYRRLYRSSNVYIL